MTLKPILSAYSVSLLGIVTTLLANFVLVRAVAGGVDKATFGAFAFVNQLSLFAGLMLAGVDSAAGIKVAEALAREDRRAATRIAGQLRWFCRAAAGVFLLLTALAVTAVLLYYAADPERARLWGGLLAATGATQSI